MEVQNNQLCILQSKLIQQIVEEEFGEESGIICEEINKRNKITLQQLCFTLKNVLDEKTIKYLLILLIKNGIIQFDRSTGNTQYFVNQQMVLSILRYPSYLKHIKSKYGLESESIVEYYLNNSQGSFEECSQFIFAEKKKFDKEDSKVGSIKKKIKDAFIQLVKNNYLNRFDSGSSKEYQVEELVETQKEKEKDKEKEKESSGKKQNINSKRKKGEDKVKAEGTVRKQIKKSQKNQIEDDEEEIYKEEPEAKKEEVNQSDDYLLYDPATKECLSYKINTRQFIHDFRTEEITKLAEGKLNIIQVKQILKVMLDSSQKIGRSSEIKTSEFLTLDQIKALLIKAKGKDAQAIKDEDLQKILRIMKRDGGKFIQIDFINGKEMYAVNIEKIMNKIKIRHVSKIIERKHNLIAGRIFRILKKYKYLEEKAVIYTPYHHILKQFYLIYQQISDIALQSLKETQKYLNKLSTEGYIEYTEVKEKDKTVNILCMFKYDEERVLSKTIEQYYQVINKRKY